MNQFLEKNISKILNLFILLQPILDLITGICLNVFHFNITFGIIIRLLFLLLIMYITIFIYKKKLSLWIYISIIFYSIFYLIGIFMYKESSYFTEIQGLAKVFYFPLLLVSLYEIKDNLELKNKNLVITLFLYLLFIFIPIIFNIGFKSYEITKSGTLGFYNSANEISGIISIITPIMFTMLLTKNNYIYKGILLLIYLIVILTVGTKTPLLSLAITIGSIFMYYIIKSIKKKSYKPIIYLSILIIIGFTSLLLILPKTNFYKNIEVHLDFLEVDNVFEIFTDYELIDHFIFSQRLTFLEDKNELYKDATIYEKLFGIGYTHDNNLTKTIEMDYFDILYSHGIIGFILFFYIYIFILIKILKVKRTKDFNRCMKLVSLLLIILLSMFTGHIITSPAVSMIVIYILLLIPHKEKLLN